MRKNSPRSRLQKILSQLDSSIEGHRLAALRAASQILRQHRRNWYDLAKAALDGGLLNENDCQDTHDGRKQEENDSFRPGHRDIHVVDAIFHAGRLKAKLAFDERIIIVHILDPGDANTIRLAKGAIITAHVDRQGNEWVISDPVF